MLALAGTVNFALFCHGPSCGGHENRGTDFDLWAKIRHLDLV
jgi:hypothetical protein